MRRLALTLALGMAIYTPALADELQCQYSTESSVRTKQEAYNKADKAHIYDTPARIAAYAKAFAAVSGSPFPDDKETIIAMIQVSMDMWVAVGFRGDCLLGTFRVSDKVYSKMLRAMGFERIKYED